MDNATNFQKLKELKMTYAEIAESLNNLGLYPPSARQYSIAAVYYFAKKSYTKRFDDQLAMVLKAKLRSLQLQTAEMI